MATEEEFIAELGKYINIKVLPQEKYKFALEIDGEERLFEVKADNENYVKVSATDTWKISFRDDTTINFERKNKVEQQKSGAIWGGNPCELYSPNDSENSKPFNLNAEDSERIKQVLKKSFENLNKYPRT